MFRNDHRSPADKKAAIERAIEKLKSFPDGDIAVIDVIACGRDAIPALRALLLKRERSGLHQVRARVVDVLAKLGASDELIEYLERQDNVADPVERLGEDVVISAAARALAFRTDQRVFNVLMHLAERPCLAGVIYALGASRREEAVPFLINALSEDASRLTAEAALKKFGSKARNALMKVAAAGANAGERPSESQLRQRRSAIKLLAEMGISRSTWQNLRPLIDDGDTRIAVLACEICFVAGSASDKRDAVFRLIDLYPDADLPLRDEIERYLLTHLYIARETKAGEAQLHALMATGGPAASFIERLMCRVRSET